MTSPTDLTGARFGMLTALSRDKSGKRGVTWLCQCECGRTRAIPRCDLARGDVTSCGCKKNKGRWPARDAELVALHAAGMTDGQIAKAMRIPRDSAGSRRKRLKLAGNGRQGARGPAYVPPQPTVAVRKAAAAAVVAPVLPALVTRVFTPLRTCQRPLWADNARPTHQYCGAPVARAGDRAFSYCAACCRRLFQVAA